MTQWPHLLFDRKAVDYSPLGLCSCDTFVCQKARSRMASALEQLLGTSVVDGSGQTVAVSSLAGNDKVLGQYANMCYLVHCILFIRL